MFRSSRSLDGISLYLSVNFLYISYSDLNDVYACLYKSVISTVNNYYVYLKGVNEMFVHYISIGFIILFWLASCSAEQS